MKYHLIAALIVGFIGAAIYLGIEHSCGGLGALQCVLVCVASTLIAVIFILLSFIEYALLRAIAARMLDDDGEISETLILLVERRAVCSGSCLAVSSPGPLPRSLRDGALATMCLVTFNEWWDEIWEKY